MCLLLCFAFLAAACVFIQIVCVCVIVPSHLTFVCFYGLHTRSDDRAAEKDAMLAAASLKLQLSQLLLTDMLTMRESGVFNWKKHYDQAVSLCGQVGVILCLCARVPVRMLVLPTLCLFSQISLVRLHHCHCIATQAHSHIHKHSITSVCWCR